MGDEVLELLRKNLIDVALDNHDWERLRLLTSENAEAYMISPQYHSPFDFLCYDEHFFERRVLGDEHGATLNYRYRDFVTNRVYIAEIHIPLNSHSGFQAHYRLKSRRIKEESVARPQWFSGLVSRAQALLPTETL